MDGMVSNCGSNVVPVLEIVRVRGGSLDHHHRREPRGDER